jgi:predicted alpha/beta hydrolase family esterase
MPQHSRQAQLLQVACLGQLALAMAFLAWRWTAAPGQAIAGALAIALVSPAVLAIEFAILWRVGRSADLPRPSFAQLCVAWASESVHLFRAFYWRQPFRWRAEPDHLDSTCAGRAGVVLVHGFMCNRGFWNAWVRALRRRGHACIAVNLEPPYASIDAYARAIEDAVTRVSELTRRPPVLVCHSMGGLAARAWWRTNVGRRPVERIVTIGTPHRGTWLAHFSGRINGRQMRLHSAWIAQLAQHEAACPLPPCTCWYSNCDNIVFPADTATLPGADNRFVPGVPHVALAFTPAVVTGCLELLSGTQASCQGESVTGSSSENI